MRRWTWLHSAFLFAALLLAVLQHVCAPRVASADIFNLQNEGQVHGELVNKDEKPREKYVIKTIEGGQVTLEAAQVKSVTRQSPLEIDYDRRRLQAADTVEDQWALAQWCLDKHLSKHRKTHLEQIVALEPDHAEARRGLGYRKVQGHWVTQEDQMKAAGYVRYKGSWRLPQEVALAEKSTKDDKAEKDWFKKLKMYREWLAGAKAEQAEQAIAAINDPYAVRALADFMSDEGEPRETKYLVLDALVRIGNPHAMNAVADSSLHDVDEEMRLACLEKLVKADYRAVVPKYTLMLKSKDNIMVNRAGVALAAMKDPSTVGPLIDALVTRHSYIITKGNPGQTSVGFGGSSPGGFSFGSPPPQKVTENLANKDVLNALLRLTGPVNFDYDVQAWKRWYAAQAKPSTLDARRD